VGNCTTDISRRGLFVSNYTSNVYCSLQKTVRWTPPNSDF